MKKIFTLLETMMSVFEQKKAKDAPSYFDYSSKEKKKIINDAAKGAIRMQNELVDKYNKMYPNAAH